MSEESEFMERFDREQIMNFKEFMVKQHEQLKKDSAKAQSELDKRHAELEKTAKAALAKAEVAFNAASGIEAGLKSRKQPDFQGMLEASQSSLSASIAASLSEAKSYAVKVTDQKIGQISRTAISSRGVFNAYQPGLVPIASSTATDVLRADGTWGAGGGGGGVTTFAALTDKTTVDIPAINGPTATALATKQATLVSATNIKTINGSSILGAGNLTVSGSGGTTIFLSTTVTSDAAGQIGYGGTAPSGADQTAAVQAAINSVPAGGTLVWDVAVGLSAPIYYPSNFTVVAPNRACGAIARAVANCPMFRLNGMQTPPATNTSVASQNWFGKLDPAHGSTSPWRLFDPAFVNVQNLRIKGGTWNGNKAAQTGTGFSIAYGFASVFQFYGYDGIILDDVLILGAFGAVATQFVNGRGLELNNVEIDNSPLNTIPGHPELNQGGFEIDGPNQRVRVINPITHAIDDHISPSPDGVDASFINTNYGGGSSVCFPGINFNCGGDVTDVYINNWIMSDGIENLPSSQGLRILSNGHKAHRIKIDGWHGRTKLLAALMGPWTGAGAAGGGDLDDIDIIGATFEVISPQNSGVGTANMEILGNAGTVRILNRIRGVVPAGGVPDVAIMDYLGDGGKNVRLLHLEGDYYDDGTGGDVAAAQVKVSSSVERIIVRTNQSRASSVIAKASPVVITAAGANIGTIDFLGDVNRATNIVKHAAGSIGNVFLRGSHRNANGGSPVDIASSLNISNLWYKDLAFNSGGVAAISGAGSVTNNNSYSEGLVYGRDDFTAANGTALNGRTPAPVQPGSATWATLIGAGAQQTIVSNKASLDGTSTTQALVLDFGHADGVLTDSAALATAPVGSAFGLIFRATDANNLWLLYVTGTVDATLFRKVAGSNTVMGSIAFTAGTSLHSLSVVLAGNSISVAVDGTSVASVTDAFNATATKHGILGYLDTVTHDGFQMTS